MTEPSIYRAILHPRTYGLQTYTDDQLRVQAIKLGGCEVYRGPEQDPGHVLAVRVVPEGVEALIRVWREGDCAVNTETGSRVRSSAATMVVCSSSSSRASDTWVHAAGPTSGKLR